MVCVNFLIFGNVACYCQCCFWSNIKATHTPWPWFLDIHTSKLRSKPWTCYASGVIQIFESGIPHDLVILERTDTEVTLVPMTVRFGTSIFLSHTWSMTVSFWDNLTSKPLITHDCVVPEHPERCPSRS